MSHTELKLEHPIEVGQTYTDTRTGDTLHLIFLDDLNYLFRDTDDDRARLGKRRMLEKDVVSGRYELQGTAEFDADTVQADFEAIEWAEVSGIGEATATALNEAGFTTDRDVTNASDDDLLKVSGIGESNLENLQQYL